MNASLVDLQRRRIGRTTRINPRVPRSDREIIRSSWYLSEILVIKHYSERLHNPMFPELCVAKSEIIFSLPFAHKVSMLAEVLMAFLHSNGSLVVIAHIVPRIPDPCTLIESVGPRLHQW